MQESFLRLPSYEVMYGGGKGSGKSDALLAAPTRWVGHKSFRALLLRREWKQAERTLYARSRELYPMLGAYWLAKRNRWVFPSGAEIEINGADNEEDVERYFGLPDLCFLGIDQLEHFTRGMYLALISCVRSSSGLPLRIRSSANPGGVGHDWLVERFAPWVYPREGQPWHDAAYSGTFADSGQALWYRTTSGDHGAEEQCERDTHEPACVETPVRCAPGAPCPLHRPRSRVYVHARVKDNPHLRGTQYEASLHGLDPVDRARYLEGNWMVRAKPGIYFSRTTIAVVDAMPFGAVVARVRYFDRAGTDAADATKKTAWTAGVRMSLLDTGLLVVEDVIRGLWGPGEVDAQILGAGRDDPRGTVLAIERDPGQAGKAQAYYDARMLQGLDFVLPLPQGDKATRMKPFSAQAREKNVVLIKGAWNGPFLRELEDCPGGLWDQIDSCSGALILLLKLQERAIAHRRAAGQHGRDVRSPDRIDRSSLGPLRSGV